MSKPSVKVGDGPEADCERALRCLYIAVDASVAANVGEKVRAALAAAREEGREDGYKAGLIVGSARAEAATVECEACDNGVAPKGRKREGSTLWACQAPGCVNGRVDARLDAAMWAVTLVEKYGGKTIADIVRIHAFAKYGPEAKETT